MSTSTKNRDPREVPLWALVSCVFLIVVAISVQTWWSATQDRSLTLATANKNGLLQVRILEEHANRILQDASRVLNAAAEELQTKNDAVWGDEATVRQVLSVQRRESPFIHALTLIDSHGKLWASSLRFPVEAADLSTQSHIVHLRLSMNVYQKNAILGMPYQNKKTNQFLIFRKTDNGESPARVLFNFILLLSDRYALFF